MCRNKALNLVALPLFLATLYFLITQKLFGGVFVCRVGEELPLKPAIVLIDNPTYLEKKKSSQLLRCSEDANRNA